MTRMLFLGRPGSQVRKAYKAVLEAQLAAVDAVCAGVPAKTVDRAARRVLASHGLANAFVHSTGHGLGLEIHEPPRIGKKEKTPLESGMAITIEPGVYLEGFGGIRIEDTVAVTDKGCEVLTPTSKGTTDLVTRAATVFSSALCFRPVCRKLLSYSIVTIEEIRELIQLVTDTGVAELEVQRGENRVRIRRAFAEAHDIAVPGPPAPSNVAAANPPAPASKAEREEASEKGPRYCEIAHRRHFLRCASPGAPPFVRVGETVQPGKVLCIIESMKLMNEIEAEIGGVIVSKLVPNGQPVEYGEALFAIRPV